MPQRQPVSAVESFFTSYREAFERADAAAVAEHFGESVHVASDTGSGVRLEFMTGADWRGTIEQLLARYQALGVSTAEPQNVEVVGVSERLAQASVHWALSDRDRRALYEFQALYTLTRDGTRWRIVAIAHDELPQSRRYLVHHPLAGKPPDGTPPAAAG
jgi:ketosteroid isomerase-like protein